MLEKIKDIKKEYGALVQEAAAIQQVQKVILTPFFVDYPRILKLAICY
jgi:hypothetical protein